MPEPTGKAVFLSYASQDAEAVLRIAEALRASGVEVWFDKDELVGGDAWDAKIRGQIASCALFVPVISAATQARREGYFRREWKQAAERTRDMADGTPFLLPVVIDATRDAEALVPIEFKAVQWTRLPGGEAGAAFVTRVRNLLWLDQPVARVSRPVVAEPTGQEPRATPKADRRVPAAAWLVVLLVLAGVGVFVWRQSRPETAAVPNAGAGMRPPASETFVTPAVTPAVSENSISVLPFENRSTEPDSAYFADGIQDEVIAGLSLLSKLRVIGSRNSLEIFRASKKPLPQIARELGVAWVLRGNVARAVGNVTVNVQLIRGDTDQIFWAQTFRSDANGAAAIQSEIVAGVTTALKLAVSSEEKALLSRTATTNPEAYDLFLRQREILNQTGGGAPETLRARRQLLEKAVTLDPSFVKAWAALVMLRRSGASNPTPQALASSKAALETLEKLAPQAPETALARVSYFADTVAPSQALAMYENFAKDRAPSVEILVNIGSRQQDLGRWTDAIASYRQAIALDPVDPQARRFLISALLQCRRLQEARTEQRGLIALVPDARPEGFKLGRLAYNIEGSAREMEKFFAGLPREEWEEAEVVKLRAQWAQIRGAREEAVALARLPVDSVFHTIFSGMAFAANGDLESAKDVMAKRVSYREKKGTRRTEWDASELAIMQAIGGDRTGALATAAELERMIPDLSMNAQIIMHARLASIYAWAGDKDRALRELTSLLQKPGYHFIRFNGGDDYRTRINVYELRTSLEFSPLQGDPRFEALLNDPKNNEPLF